MNKKSNTSIQMIADYEGDITKLFDIDMPDTMPILATRNIVMFPGVISPVLIGRASSVNLINKLRKNPDAVFAIFCQNNPEIEFPSSDDLYNYGVYAKLVRILEMPGPGSNITAIVQGLGRCRLDGLTKTRPYLVGQVSPAHEDMSENSSREFRTAIEDLRLSATEFIKENEEIPDESQFALN
ncbi:MAG: LON peptidase substrate-binding domain-containing protein, partial [Prevotella sp.]|nr:LON peptidase substrate-binding domain-containing protein [Prevotella sp.]